MYKLVCTIREAAESRVW